MAIVGWKVDGSSSEPAYNVYESDLPISPPTLGSHANRAAISDRVAAVRRFQRAFRPAAPDAKAEVPTRVDRLEGFVRVTAGPLRMAQHAQTEAPSP